MSMYMLANYVPSYVYFLVLYGSLYKRAYIHMYISRYGSTISISQQKQKCLTRNIKVNLTLHCQTKQVIVRGNHTYHAVEKIVSKKKARGSAQKERSPHMYRFFTVTSKCMHFNPYHRFCHKKENSFLLSAICV